MDEQQERIKAEILERMRVIQEGRDAEFERHRAEMQRLRMRDRAAVRLARVYGISQNELAKSLGVTRQRINQRGN